MDISFKIRVEKNWTKIIGWSASIDRPLNSVDHRGNFSPARLKIGVRIKVKTRKVSSFKGLLHESMLAHTRKQRVYTLIMHGINGILLLNIWPVYVY